MRDKYYANCHAYISRNYGKAKKCEHCHIEGKKKYEWALLKGKTYSKEISDYIQLCTSCHRHYDFNEEWSKNMSLSRTGKKVPANTGKNHKKSIPIYRLNLNGDLIDEWESINQCSVNTGIKKQNILECLKGNIKQIKGFIFKYQMV